MAKPSENKKWNPTRHTLAAVTSLLHIKDNKKIDPNSSDALSKLWSPTRLKTDNKKGDPISVQSSSDLLGRSVTSSKLHHHHFKDLSQLVKPGLSKERMYPINPVSSRHFPFSKFKKPLTSSLAFAVLSVEQSEEIVKMEVGQMEERIKSLFHLNPVTDEKDAALLDFYVAALCWSKQQRHSPLQLSAFFSVVHKLLDKIRIDNASRVETLLFFRTMLKMVKSGPKPNVTSWKDLVELKEDQEQELLENSEKESYLLEFFNEKQSLEICKYVESTIFQHFKLHQLVFSPDQPPLTDITRTENILVEVPPQPHDFFADPLDEGITEEVHDKYLSIKSPPLVDRSVLRFQSSAFAVKTPVPSPATPKGRQGKKDKRRGRRSLATATPTASDHSRPLSLAKPSVSASAHGASTPKPRSNLGSEGKVTPSTKASVLLNESETSVFPVDRFGSILARLTADDVTAVIDEVTKEILQEVKPQDNVQPKRDEMHHDTNGVGVARKFRNNKKLNR